MNNKELTLDKALQNDRRSYNRGYDSCKKKVLEILKDFNLKENDVILVRVLKKRVEEL